MLRVNNLHFPKKVSFQTKFQNLKPTSLSIKITGKIKIGLTLSIKFFNLENPILKEATKLQPNYYQNLFSLVKNRRKHNQYFQITCWMANSHFSTSNYPHTEKQVYFLQTVFIWSYLLWNFEKIQFASINVFYSR